MPTVIYGEPLISMPSPKKWIWSHCDPDLWPFDLKM